MTSAVAPQSVMPEPPLPQGAGEINRVRHTRLRRRLLYGLWEQDLIRRLEVQLGHVRRKAWGIADMSANAFRLLCQQLAVLYDRPPTIGHLDEEAAKTLSKAVKDAGLWALMPRVQRDLIGMREMFVRIDVRGSGEEAELIYRPVPPDLLQAEASPDNPDVPVYTKEAVLRRDATGLVWTWEVFDIRDPNTPVWQILDAKGDPATDKWGELPDGSKPPAEGLKGEAYDWRDGDEPIIPGTLYHAARTGMLWDPWEGAEAVEGTLNAGVMWTFFGHCIRNASWPQRYMLGAKFASTQTDGEEADGSDARTGVVADPAAIAELVADENSSTQPTAGQWTTSTEPDKLEQAIAAYERRLATFGGLSPADFQRTSGDPRSGYALAVSREGQREAQRRFLPNASRGDLEVLSKSAALLNRAGGQKLPTDGWVITYEGIPLSRDEQAALLELAEANLIDKVDAYSLLNPGTDRAEAERRLDAIARTNARYRA